jgi:hypothetical protein
MPTDEDPSSKDPSSKDPSSKDPARVELATFFVTSFVHNSANATAEWLQDGATAFDTSLNKALAGTYTSSDLVKDWAALWARSVRHALRMLPATGPGGAAETTPDGGSGSSTGSASGPGSGRA